MDVKLYGFRGYDVLLDQPDFVPFLRYVYPESNEHLNEPVFVVLRKKMILFESFNAFIIIFKSWVFKIFLNIFFTAGVSVVIL